MVIGSIISRMSCSNWFHQSQKFSTVDVVIHSAAVSLVGKEEGFSAVTRVQANKNNGTFSYLYEEFTQDSDTFLSLKHEFHVILVL